MKISISVKLLLASLVMSILFAGIAMRVPAANASAKTAEELGAEKAAKEKAVSQEAMRKLVQAAKDKINNTAWQIDLRQSVAAVTSQKGKKVSASVSENDTLNFRNSRFESASMVSNGFTPTNYTVRLKGKKNEIVIWETMQTSAGKGVAFWRGEIDGDAMRGVLSWQLDDQNKQDYSFVSMKKDVAAPAPEVIPAAAPVTAVLAPAVTMQPAEGETAAVAPKPAETKIAVKEASPKKNNFWGKK